MSMDSVAECGNVGIFAQVYAGLCRVQSFCLIKMLSYVLCSIAFQMESGTTEPELPVRLCFDCRSQKRRLQHDFGPHGSLPDASALRRSIRCP